MRSIALDVHRDFCEVAINPHVARVVIANTRKLRAIVESKVKTDKLDARTLCELLAVGYLPAVWSPDEFTRALRRLHAEFRKDMDALVTEFGKRAVDKAIAELPDERWPSVSLH